MQPTQLLYLSILLAGAEAAVARPGSADLALRHDETTTATTVSAAPGWWWQALAQGAQWPVAAWGVCHQLGFQRCSGSAAVGAAAGLRVMVNEINSGQDSPRNGAEAAELPTKTGNSKMIEARRLRARVAGDLASSGIAFESVSDVRSLRNARRDTAGDTAAAAGYTFDIRGLAEEKGGPAADYSFTAFGDGTGHVHVVPRRNKTAAPGTLGKRGGSPGFKISYRVRERGNPDIFPSPHAVDIATRGIADDWARRADEGKDQFGDYIAAIGMGSSGTTVQFRIIPEKNKFGENYEDVNKCNT
ncbi:uncharacterized protein PG986_013945 [Apiospora aurea]|uniref:Uncharacterized protein n=1 Tax=Apiospora aurea TaxID=335848 RepID=A0ABR1PXB9_9PEZI